ncbi:MAG TPA: hypothetical protein VLT34_16515 [Arthrobacter sp.]|nr:hypothetical protein [Arthrobacter sp.]
MKTTIHSTLAAAGLAGILLTTACAAPQASTQPDATTPATTAPVLRATASTTPPAAPSESASSVPETPQAPVLETFTFPDGHISFSHPTGWTVKTQPGPALNEEAQKTSVDATVFDASGAEVAHVLSGMYGDGAAGPVKRTVLDHAPVPGITDLSGEGAEFGFAYDEIPGGGSTGGPYYFMDVRRAHEFLPNQDTSGSNQVQLPNGVLTAVVVFGGTESKPPFATPDAAKAWMGSEQYAQLKAMLLSLRYK